MTRNREVITQQIIDELKQKIEVAKGDGDTLKNLLKAELARQEEAEWEAVHHDINDAVRFLRINAAKYVSSGQYSFVKKWGMQLDGHSCKNVEREEFPVWWHHFVRDFFFKKRDSNGGAIVFDLEYKLGLREPPVSEVSMADESVAQREARLARERKQRSVQAEKNKEIFRSESEFWNIKNIYKLLVAYLSTFPEQESIEEEVVNLRHYVVESLLAGVLSMEDGFSIFLFEEYIDALRLVRGRHHSITQAREHEEIYLIVKSIYDDFATARQGSAESEWHRINQTMDEASNRPKAELYPEYVGVIDTLHQAYRHATVSVSSVSFESVASRMNQLAQQPLFALIAGGASGMFMGGAIIAGLVLGGALAVLAAPVEAVIIVLALLLSVVVGVGAGYGVSRCLTRSALAEGGNTATVNTAPPTSSFMNTCSSAACAVILGLTGGCFAVSAVNAAPPIEQQQPASQEDQDDAAEEIEVPSTGVSASGKRFG